MFNTKCDTYRSGNLCKKLVSLVRIEWKKLWIHAETGVQWASDEGAESPMIAAGVFSN